MDKLRKVQGLPLNTYVLTSLGWEKVEKINMDTKIVTVRYSPDRIIECLQPKEFSLFHYKGKIRKYSVLDDIKEPFTLKVKGYDVNPKSILSTFSIDKTELIDFSGKLVFFDFSISCGIFIRSDVKSLVVVKKDKSTVINHSQYNYTILEI